MRYITCIDLFLYRIKILYFTESPTEINTPNYSLLQILIIACQVVTGTAEDLLIGGLCAYLIIVIMQFL